MSVTTRGNCERPRRTFQCSSVPEILLAIHQEPHGNLMLAQDRASWWALLLALLILCVLLPGTGIK